jgi:hypothetical protein
MIILGMGMSIDMEIADGQMSSCPFMTNEKSMCQMSITQHIALWQQALLGVPTKKNLLSLAIVLLAATLILLAKLFSKIEELTRFASRLFSCRRAHLVKFVDPLLLAFSDGILNPKIYEPNHI